MKAFSVLEQSTHFLTRAHSGVPTNPIAGRAAWRAEDLGSFRDQIHRLTPGETTAIETLLDRVAASGVSLGDIGPGDWVDPAVEPIIDLCRERLFDGQGFAALSGIPVERWPLARAELFMAVLGSQFGRLGLQNPRGDVIGHVQNRPGPTGQPHARNYITDREFRPHCDAADMLGLLAIRPAAHGGQSRLTSSVSVFNALLAEAPHLARRLFEPVLLDLVDEQPADAEPVIPITPAAHHAGQLKTFYISDYFRGAERHPGYAIDNEAKALYDSYERLATDPKLEVRFDLAPGDLLLVNNHVMLHARDAFEDAPGAERLLLRFLVSVTSEV
jgi:hypothetical protein